MLYIDKDITNSEFFEVLKILGTFSRFASFVIKDYNVHNISN